jgi:hypothetical protein
MSYKIEIRERRSYPVIVCDHCGGKIEKGSDGNAMWMEPVSAPRDSIPRRYDVTHTHKKCCMRYERANPCETGDAWMTHELDHDLFMLCLNVVYDAKRGNRLARSLSCFG